MTNEELLDQYAIQAMNAFIQKFGNHSNVSIALESYQLAERMLETRESVLYRRKQEEDRKQRSANSNLKELDLPIRYHNCLSCEGILMKEDLLEWRERDLRRIPNLGMKGIKMIKEAMSAHGLKLKGQE